MKDFILKMQEEKRKMSKNEKLQFPLAETDCCKFNKIIPQILKNDV